MKDTWYKTLTEKALNNISLTKDECISILEETSVDLLSLLHAAFRVRHAFYKRDVSIHILNNGKNGECPEDCSYCVQSNASTSDIVDYPMKSERDILLEAKTAYESGAFRYCMVFSGRGPSKHRVKKLANLIKQIKDTYPIQVCLSPGLIDEEDAKSLKNAGLDRLNHNLNTSESFYSKICTTHTYTDRMNTLKNAQKAGLETCSGLIVGMGESALDIIEVGFSLKKLQSPSIPVNFYIPVEGAPLAETTDPFNHLTPEYCLRVLCLMRFLNPKAEIRAAAGREIHLRSLQSLALYPANSLFMDGYLNTKGSNMRDTLEMIKDAGFTPKTPFNIDALINGAKNTTHNTSSSNSTIQLKTAADLHITT
jgi:biotin synthase